MVQVQVAVLYAASELDNQQLYEKTYQNKKGHIGT